MSDAGLPLDGVLVVSIEQAVAAPLCTLKLADAGARVIKIERAEGETARHYDSAVEGVSAYFVWLNRGKESATLDLKNTGDLALLHRMLERADVFVQNLAPGASDRLGLSKPELAERYPTLIAVNIVGYGQDTPAAKMRAYDMLVQAESGLCSVTGSPELASKVGVSVADIATGMNAHAAILEALLQRGRTGRGQVIEISMFDGMADWMSVPLLHYEHAGRETRRYGLAHASIYPYRPFNCSDGKAVVISIQQNSEWHRFCTRVVERADLVDDERFKTNSLRVANRELLDSELEPAFASLSLEEAISKLNAAQIAWGRVSSVADLPEHQALRRIEVLLPNGKTVSLPRPPAYRVHKDEPRRVPALGSDTAQIRTEFSGTLPA